MGCGINLGDFSAGDEARRFWRTIRRLLPLVRSPFKATTSTT